MAIFRQHSTRNLCGGQIDGLKFRQDKSTLKFDKMVAGLVSNLYVIALYYINFLPIKKACPTFYPTLFWGDSHLGVFCRSLSPMD